MSPAFDGALTARVEQPQPKLTETDRRLAILRERHGLAEIEACDAEAVALLPTGQRAGVRKTLETLATGKQLACHVLGDDGSTNAPSRCMFRGKDGRVLTAFVKARLQEAGFRVDQETGEDEHGHPTVVWQVYRRVYLADENAFAREKFEFEPADERIAELIRQQVSPGFKQAVCTHLGRELSVPPEGIRYAFGDDSEFNTRAGVLPNEATIREWAVSRFDMVLAFDLVPLTVIRTDLEADDIASVQAEVLSSVDPKRPSGELTSGEFAQMFDRAPDEWANMFPGIATDDDSSRPVLPGEFIGEPVRSIVRAGIFAYLVGDLDGIPSNLLIDPTSKSVKKIDNGLALGALTGETINFKVADKYDPTKLVDAEHTDVVRSFPLELVMQHGLSLDQEARAQLTALLAKLQAGGREREHMLNILRAVFRSYESNKHLPSEKTVVDRLAKKQLEGFLERLQDVVAHDHPTNLTKGVDYSVELEEGKNRADLSLFDDQAA